MHQDTLPDIHRPDINRTALRVLIFVPFFMACAFFEAVIANEIDPGFVRNPLGALAIALSAAAAAYPLAEKLSRRTE